MSDSDYLEKGPCPSCDSSDACALYSDGHRHCFSCGETFQPDDKKKKGGKVAKGLISRADIQIIGLKERSLRQETCEKFGYGVSRYSGKPVQVAPYYDADGNMVAQKLRFPNKEFVLLGSLSNALPYGSQLWPRTGRKLVVTEGEIDAMSMSQAQGNKYPVVSVPNGAQGARKFVARNRDYFLGFEEVIFMFDMDAAGQKAARECASVVAARAKIATLPEKDANEMLKKGRVKDLLNAMWRAEDYRPEGLVSLADLKAEVMKEPEVGLSWPFDTLTKLTYGIRTGEIYAFGAGTGIGKTDFFAQTIHHLVTKHNVSVGVFSLEQQPVETGRRIVGKELQRPLHIPEVEWTEDEFDDAWERLTENGAKVYLYDSFCNNDWDLMREKIEYLVHADGVRYFFIDHLTALAAWKDDERKALEKIMSDMGMLVKKLDITIFLISHLATPQGTPHEEGGRVMIRHLKGSRAIGFWCHYIFGLERDQQSEDPVERRTTTFRVLKDRYTGRATGATFFFSYDFKSGWLYECEAPDKQDPGAFGFDKLSADDAEAAIENADF